ASAVPADAPPARAMSAPIAPLPFAIPTNLPLADRPPVRFAKPARADGPRRIGLQAGHWLTQSLPADLRGLETATGTSWGSVLEWQLNIDVAQRAAEILRRHGHAVDVLPTAVPPGYLADAFVAIHADGDPSGLSRGFKVAHSAYPRGPHDALLAGAIAQEYAHATGLPIDPRLTGRMYRYYAFGWSRYRSSAAPHTPAAIIEMGFLTHADDRAVIVARPDLVAQGLANGILRFLAEIPADAVFVDDLVLTPWPPYLGGQPGT
ncbi:MAG: N-acetylmuramoyl-L-alanine amidase, partial [Solirubrobacteraceae bacterium]